MTADERPDYFENDEIVDVVEHLLVAKHAAGAGFVTPPWVLEGAALIIVMAELCHLDYEEADRRARAEAARMLGERARVTAEFERSGNLEEIGAELVRAHGDEVAAVAAELIEETSLE